MARQSNVVTNVNQANGKKRKHVGKKEVKMKRACDACTKSKVKCVKEPGKDRCNLCTKRGCPCTYQPRRHRQRTKSEKTIRKNSNARGRTKKIPTPSSFFTSQFQDFQQVVPTGYPMQRTVTKAPKKVSAHDFTFPVPKEGEDFMPTFSDDLFDFPEYEGSNVGTRLDNYDPKNDTSVYSCNERRASYKFDQVYPLDELFYDFTGNLTVY